MATVGKTSIAMSENASDESQRRIAEAIRAACIQAAQQGYQAASIAGLCEEGALEAAISAMHMVDLDAVVARAKDWK
jgi:hypothetical protein